MSLSSYIRSPDPTMEASVIGSFDVFQDLPDAALESLAPLFRRHNVGAKQYVIATSHNYTDVYFLINGAVRVCAFSEQGKQVQFEDLGTGMMFGEMAVIDGAQRSGDCIALDDCELAVMRGKDFLEILRKYPDISIRVMMRLVSLVRTHMARVYEFSTASVSQRVRYELLRMASVHAADERDIVIADAPTHADIAARISTHREAVTRELKLLEANGLVTWRRGQHVIHDVVGLTD